MTMEAMNGVRRNKKTPVHLGEHELPFFLAKILASILESLESAAWAWPVGLAP